ncbi:MAG: hypothetical protein U0232_19705 [Thermomicrobiales bacterium]
MRRWVPPAPGMTPMLISGWPKRALSAATIRSQVIASSLPPPRQKPLTAAIRGFLSLRMRSHCPKRMLTHVDRARAGHLPDVGPGGEGAVVAGEHDRADLVVVVEGFQGVGQFVHQFAAERVERLGAVEADEGDVGVGFGEDVR